MNQAINITTRQVLVAVLLVLALLPVVVGGAYVVNKYRWASATVKSVEPRYARLLGLQSHQEELAQSMARATELLSHFAYPASETQDPSIIGNQVQGQVRSVFQSAGLQIQNSMVQEPVGEPGAAFRRIPLTLRTEGTLSGLQKVLLGLEELAPIVVVQDMRLQVTNRVTETEEARMSMTFSLFVLQVQQ